MAEDKNVLALAQLAERRLIQIRELEATRDKFRADAEKWKAETLRARREIELCDKQALANEDILNEIRELLADRPEGDSEDG